jgi:ABC-2 type transport system ATP-binding protein
MPIIEVSRLAKSYGSRAAVADVSFSVDEGEIFGILGPNGAGKTTTVECAIGLRHRDGGSVRVLGVDPQLDRRTVREQVGVQLQHARLPERLTVGEAMRLYSSFYEQPADWKDLLAMLGLSRQVDQRFGKLSGGQQQRLSIALALVGGPRVAVLDELTTGLDPGARRETWDLMDRVRDRGVTVLLVTHFMPEAEHLCDRLAVIAEGRVVAQGTPAQIVEAGGTGQQRMRLRVASDRTDLAELLLRELPEVSGVARRADQVIVAGTGDVVAAVTGALARAGIIASNLRVEQVSLDDAFIALTGDTAAAEGTAAYERAHA